MPELTNFTVTDTSTIGKLTMLTIDIDPSTDDNTINQGVFTGDGTEFQKQLTISIDRLGLAEVFSADVMTIREPSRQKLSSQNSIHSRNTNQPLNVAGINSSSVAINIEPLVYIDDAETKLIIVDSFSAPYTRKVTTPFNNRKVRLSVIGRRR
mgnify:CR=1 FL=1